MGRIEIFKLSKAELEMYKKQTKCVETFKRSIEWKWHFPCQKKQIK